MKVVWSWFRCAISVIDLFIYQWKVVWSWFKCTSILFGAGLVSMCQCDMLFVKDAFGAGSSVIISESGLELSQVC